MRDLPFPAVPQWILVTVDDAEGNVVYPPSPLICDHNPEGRYIDVHSIVISGNEIRQRFSGLLPQVIVCSPIPLSVPLGRVHGFMSELINGRYWTGQTRGEIVQQIRTIVRNMCVG